MNACIVIACVQGSTNGTNGIPISFKVLPMVPMVMQLVPLALPMVPMTPWYANASIVKPMVQLTTNDTIGKITNGTIGKPRTRPLLTAGLKKIRINSNREKVKTPIL